MARVFGLTGPGHSPTSGRSPFCAPSGGRADVEFRREFPGDGAYARDESGDLARGESGDLARGASGDLARGESDDVGRHTSGVTGDDVRDHTSAGGWVPQQPGPQRPGPIGRLLGQGRHREPSTLRERLTVPGGLRGAVIRPSPRAVVGLAVVVLLAAGVLGLRVWRADASSVPVDVPARASGTPAALVSRSVIPGTGGWATGEAPGAPGASSGVSGAGTPSPSTPEADAARDAAQAVLTVHVVGAVRRPGVIRIPAGSRLVDAVQQCGGASPGADLAAVNLARILTDGEQVVIPVVGASAPPAAQAGPGSAAPSAGTPAGAPPSGGPVNLNTADAAALDTLPGVGPKIAERIIAWRTEHGRFSSVDELAEVDGIGDKLLSRLRSLVVV